MGCEALQGLQNLRLGTEAKRQLRSFQGWLSEPPRQAAFTAWKVTGCPSLQARRTVLLTVRRTHLLRAHFMTQVKHGFGSSSFYRDVRLSAEDRALISYPPILHTTHRAARNPQRH